MNIAGFAIDRRAISMQRKRVVEGGYDADGNAVETDVATAPIMAIIQPATGDKLRDAPEGIRTEAGWLCWSRSELKVDDKIIHKDITYRVLFDWPRDEGGFYRAALGRRTP